MRHVTFVRYLFVIYYSVVFMLDEKLLNNVIFDFIEEFKE